MAFVTAWLLLLPLLFFSILFLKKKRSKSNLPPRPPRLPIIGNLHQLGDLPHTSLSNLSKKYGPVMLMNLGHQPTVVVSSAETAREVMKTHDLDFCSRPSLLGPKLLSYDLRDIVFGPYGDYWNEMRRICVQQVFSNKRVQSFRFIREEEVARMMNSISELSSSSSSSPVVVNLTEKIFNYTFQMTCRIAFGKSYQGKYFDSEKFHEAIYESMNLFGSFAATDFFPYFGWMVDRVTGLTSRLEKCFKTFDTFYQQVIDEHLDPKRIKPEQEDIIDVLLEQQRDESDAGRLTTSHIKAILMNIFLGGIDTSAVTLVWAMTELIRKPEAMKKVQEEIRTSVGKKGMVEESDLNKLEYLKMVVRETLRMHPPLTLLIPRESINDSKISGYDVYAKTRILVNVWAIGRSSEYWEKPNEFIPERFMETSVDFKGQDFEFLPFGSGRRGCPGLNMGTVQVEIGLANLLYGFDWGLPTGVSKDDIDMDEIAGVVVHKKQPLQLVPTKYN